MAKKEKAEKKTYAKETKEEAKKTEKSEEKTGIAAMEEKLPPELKKKLEEMKSKLEKFQKSLLEKFEKYIIGIALLPPAKEEADKDEKKINILVLVDDSEPTKMSKQELKDKMVAIVEANAKEVDPKIAPQTLLLSEIWQSCYDGKSELTEMIAMSAPVFDRGMLSAIKIAEIHKSMILKKFEKYIVAYVLAGSLVQGKATKESDIDVFVVIDDTDVKKMTRAELKDKLRAIIIGMGIEVGEMTGIRNKLNVQVYILTDFWDSMREANPVIFTFLRDGVPFFDRGVFMPWKQLLKMGKIKPSAEAIDMYMSGGEQMLERVKFKLRDIGTEDFFWAILTPSQAAIMLYGVPPPTPKETPELMREIFVKKEGLLENSDVDTLDKVIRIRKELEHGGRKEITGKELDELLTASEEYLKKIKKLFTQIEALKEKESILGIYDMTTAVLRDALRMVGVEKATDSELLHTFEEQMIATGRVPAKFIRTVHGIMAAKKDYEENKLTKTEVERVSKEAGEFMRFIVEWMQRKRLHELDRARIKIKRGEKFGEVLLLGNTAFITQDIDAKEKKLMKAKINSDGSLANLEDSNDEELEHALAKIAVPPRVFVREPLFESLKKIFGKDLEIAV
jgi:predicted nucleotidyltransferase